MEGPLPYVDPGNLTDAVRGGVEELGGPLLEVALGNLCLIYYLLGKHKGRGDCLIPNAYKTKTKETKKV